MNHESHRDTDDGSSTDGATEAARLLMAMDACRPGSDDINGAEMAELRTALLRSPRVRRQFQQLEEFDCAIASALDEAPIPVGLADRILGNLAMIAASVSSATEEVQPAVTSDVPSDSDSLQIGEHSGAENVDANSGADDALDLNSALELSSDPNVLPMPAPAGSALTDSAYEEPQDAVRRWSRRAWVAAAAGVCVAAAAGLAVVQIYLEPEPGAYTLDDVQRLAREEFQRQFEAPFEGEPIDQLPESELSLAQEVIRSNRVQFHPLQNFLGREGMAYNLTPLGRGEAMLFVALLEAPHGAPELMVSRQGGTISTAGMSTRVWTDGTRLFALVVKGDANRLQWFMQSRGEIASAQPQRQRLASR